MKRLLCITEAFLRDVGRIGPRPLGPSSFKASSNPAMLDAPLKRYEARIAEASRDSRRIIWAIIAVCALIIVGGMALAAYCRNNPALVGTLFAGSSGSTIVFAVTVMRTAWREKYQMDLLACIIPGLSPEAAVEVVERWYFHALGPPQSPVTAAVGASAPLHVPKVVQPGAAKT